MLTGANLCPIGLWALCGAAATEVATYGGATGAVAPPHLPDIVRYLRASEPEPLVSRSRTRHSYCTRTHTHTQKKHTHTERLTKHGGWQPPRRQHRPGRAKRWLCEHDDLLDDGELVELATAPPVGVQSVVDVEPPLVLFPVRDPSVLVPVRDISTSLQCRKRACR